MRIVFCGTAPFALPSLRALVNAHHVAAVVTQPDRAGSRGARAPRPVGDAAATLGLRVLTPERLRAPESIAAILELDPDALVVAAYGQIVPAALLDGPPHGGVNVHGSVLPRWRGAAPVAASILAGDDVSGVSIMRMDTGIDTGPVYATRRVHVSATDTTPLLTERIAEHGAALLLEVLAGIAGGTAAALPQDEALATYAPRLSRDDAAVDWGALSAAEVDRHVRAMQPWPGTTVTLAGRPVRILAGEVGGAAAGGGGSPGMVAAMVGDAAEVVTAAGLYRVAAVQPPGGRPMTAAAYLRGRRVKA
jgi:methionyl-tRNA formyltransferase